jgi:dihydrofolate reductase
MGASTYEFLLGATPDAWPYAGLPTWVFTHRRLPTPPGADVRFACDDVGAVHGEMVRCCEGKNLWLVGGGAVVAQFAGKGLLDEVLLTVAPVVLGAGSPVLPARLPDPLTLAGITRFGRGMVELRYQVGGAGREGGGRP